MRFVDSKKNVQYRQSYLLCLKDEHDAFGKKH